MNINTIEFWLEIANYSNNNWKGKFSPREIQEFAEEYLYEWEESKKSLYLTDTLSTLYKQLLEDKENGNNEVDEYINTIRNGCNKYNISI